MKSDSEIREDVIRELQWDPQVPDPEAIGVAVTDGAVILTGNVPTYGHKLATVRAASRVYGVKAVADQLKVKLDTDPLNEANAASVAAAAAPGVSHVESHLVVSP